MFLDEENLDDAQNEDLLTGIELMYFAYRGFTSDPDKILSEYGYGRAHHRVVHFIKGHEGLRVNDLLAILGITKQSLNRVLRQLIENGMVEQHVGEKDRRERRLYLTEKGHGFESDLAVVQQARLREAFAQAGPEAVKGFRQVLKALMDEDQKAHFSKRIERG